MLSSISSSALKYRTIQCTSDWQIYLKVNVSSRSRVYYASITSHNTLYTMLKCAYFMTVIDGAFYVDVRVINRCETRFNHHAQLERDYRLL